MERTREAWLDEVARLGALTGREQAERVTEAALRAVGEGLARGDREALARELPEPFDALLGGAARAGELDRDGLVARVAALEPTSKGFAAEHLEAVCEAVAELADREVLLRLRKHVPGDVAELFEVRDRAPEPPSPSHHREVEPGHGDSIATGRPASKHPLSEARPDRAQEHSVAREANPHGDTKLSSAEGLTQERLGEDLATGRPASKKPVSEG
jgi:uncharacterized protein (DUF2267 family)